MACHLVGAKPSSKPMLWYCLIWPLVTNFIEILIEIQKFSFKKTHFKLSSGKWPPFCLNLNVLILNSTKSVNVVLPTIPTVSKILYIKNHCAILRLNCTSSVTLLWHDCISQSGVSGNHAMHHNFDRCPPWYKPGILICMLAWLLALHSAVWKMTNNESLKSPCVFHSRHSDKYVIVECHLEEKNKEEASSFRTKFLEDIGNICVSDNYMKFKNFINTVIKKYVPTRAMRSPKHNVPWINQKIRRMCRKKQRLFNKAKRSSKSRDWSAYKSLKKDTSKALRQAHWQ